MELDKYFECSDPTSDLKSNLNHNHALFVRWPDENCLAAALKQSVFQKVLYK